ncbi:ribosomal protein L16 (mitochondrion) [Hemiselmis andersenii]|uniref:Ribosomal protein L16 n=1 Tax=Hemiselmis andersenii TaxID=464988 RepID=B2MWV8_HEMAN|nr:ribosomal protein L16 [Hemiselmis andersenii]ACC78250.1 ribosomal protein L16 [Hemiselmis andersenii]
MLQPKKSKYRKSFRGKISGKEMKVLELAFGNFGIKVLKSGRISSQQLETLRKSILKKIKGRGKIWLRVFPYLPITAKPAEVRMGKGKGSVKYWCFPVNAGRVLIELQGISTSLSKEILKISSDILPFPVRLIHL